MWISLGTEILKNKQIYCLLKRTQWPEDEMFQNTLPNLTFYDSALQE